VQERLLSRFRWGLSADMQIPDYDTRIEILERKMKNDGLEMPKEVVKYIAYNINSNIRELEGALISLLAQSSLNRREIDLDLAKKVLRNFIKSSSKEITIDTIQRMVCEYFDVSYDKLLQNKKFIEDHWRTLRRARPYDRHSFLPDGKRPDGYGYSVQGERP
jgi:chromosomal replication initiator protein